MQAAGRGAVQLEVVGTVPLFSRRTAAWMLRGLGLVECALALWVLSGWQPLLAAAVQTALLVSMNTGGLLWARRIIPDPAGMIVKNLAFLVLAWIVAGQAGARPRRDDTRDALGRRAFRRPKQESVCCSAACTKTWPSSGGLFAGHRVFCIASAGCTAIALARDCRSPRSISIRFNSRTPQQRAAGGPCARLRRTPRRRRPALAGARRLAPPTLESFLELELRPSKSILAPRARHRGFPHRDGPSLLVPVLRRSMRAVSRRSAARFGG